MDNKDLEQGFGDVYPGVSFVVLNTLSSLLLYGVMGLVIHSFIHSKNSEVPLACHVLC